jgi:hypothetical protein
MGDLPGQGTLLLWDRVGYPCGIALGKPVDHYSFRTVILKNSILIEQSSKERVILYISVVKEQCS